MSSDDNHNNLPRSTSLTNSYSIKTQTDPTLINDEVTELFNDTQPSLSTTSLITTTLSIEQSKCISSSQKSSYMASPIQSTSSHVSGHQLTSLKQEIIPLPVHLEHEIRIKHNFDQLGN